VGDFVTAINAQDVRTWTVEDAMSLLRQATGGRVSLDWWMGLMNEWMDGLAGEVMVTVEVPLASTGRLIPATSVSLPPSPPPQTKQQQRERQQQQQQQRQRMGETDTDDPWLEPGMALGMKAIVPVPSNPG
jgi:hypothetical protein